jgi:hypothetical protein
MCPCNCTCLRSWWLARVVSQLVLGRLRCLSGSARSAPRPPSRLCSSLGARRSARGTPNRLAGETAQAAKGTNTYARQTGEISRGASEYARETVEATRAAREADERDRRLRELRKIRGLVESIFWQAHDYAGRLLGSNSPFRVAEQNQLAQALAGIDPPMPGCRGVVDAVNAGQAAGAASQARQEVEIAIHNLRASASKDASVPSPPTWA